MNRLYYPLMQPIRDSIEVRMHDPSAIGRLSAHFTCPLPRIDDDPGEDVTPIL